MLGRSNTLLERRIILSPCKCDRRRCAMGGYSHVGVEFTYGDCQCTRSAHAPAIPRALATTPENRQRLVSPKRPPGDGERIAAQPR
jgi:hypothetical protein